MGFLEKLGGLLLPLCSVAMTTHEGDYIKKVRLVSGLDLYIRMNLFVLRGDHPSFTRLKETIFKPLSMLSNC